VDVKGLELKRLIILSDEQVKFDTGRNDAQQINVDDRQRLCKSGCKLMQGYGIAPPMPSGQIVAWVREFQPDRLFQKTAHG